MKTIYLISLSILLSSCQKITVEIPGGGGNEPAWVEPTGVLDTLFGQGGIALINSTTSTNMKGITLLSDGKILISGDWGHDFSAIRLAKNGTVDSSFSNMGRYTYSFTNPAYDQGQKHHMFSDESFIIYGFTRNLYANNVDFGFVKLTKDAVRDSGFGNNGIAYANFGTGFDYIRKITPSASGFWAVGSSLQGAVYHSVASMHLSNGSLDTSFNTTGLWLSSSSGESLWDVAAVANGYALMTGHRSYQVMTYLMKPDGTLDSSFGSSGVALTSSLGGEIGEKILVYPDGKFLVGGTSDWGKRWILIRYNSNGSVDSSFGSAGIVNLQVGVTNPSHTQEIKSLSLQPDGKIIVAGVIQNNTTGKDLAVLRLRSDGTIDTTFGNGGFLNIDHQNQIDSLEDMVVDSTGKIFLVGNTQSMPNYAAMVVKIK